MSFPTPLALVGAPIRSPASDSRLIALSLTGIAAVFIYLLVYHAHHERRDAGHLGDFPTFYQAAQFAREHRDIYTAGHRETDQMYVYPPLIAFLYIPFTFLSLPNAAMIMLFLTALILLGSVFLSARTMLDRLSAMTPTTLCAAALLIAILSENEMRGEMTMLETDALMLLMFALALHWLDRRPVLAGVALAFAFNIKYLSIVALPYLILRRRWSAVAGMLIGTVVFALLPAIQLGWHEDIRCLRVSMGGLLRWVGISPDSSHSITVHNIADGLSVSITSALARVMGAHGFSNPQILVAAAGVAFLALVIVIIMYQFEGLPLWQWPNRRRQAQGPYLGLIAMEWAGLVTIALAFSPDTNTRHLVLTVLVNAAAASLLVAPKLSVSRAPALIGAVVIFLGYIMPGARTLRHLGFNHFVYGVPCWGLLIGYLMILLTGLNYISTQRRAHQDDTLPTPR